MTRSEPIRLQGSASRYELSFPLAHRLAPRQARLHLEFSNSNALIGHRSQLRVLLNGWHVTQIRLDPDNPNGVADLNLPVDKLKPGYNQLEFATAQHYSEDRCEFTEAPELWTEIDGVKSSLSLTNAAANLEPSLAQLGWVFEETLRDYRLNIVQPGEMKSEEQLGWGAVIAEGVALRLKYAPLQVSLNAAKSEGDQVLVGRAEQLAGLLGSAVSRITGPYLGIEKRPDQPGAFRLVVSGVNDAEVTRAARAFGVLKFPFPDSPYTLVGDLQEAPGAIRTPGVLDADRSYTFQQLGYETLTLDGNESKPLEISVKVPADWYAAEQSQVDLWLHVSYRAALREDSLLNFKLNGKFQKSVYLKEVAGAEYRGYRLSIPLRSFRPGNNVLSFEANAKPLASGACQNQADRLYITLFDDSLIQFPPVGHYAKLPDLDLLARTGFPYASTGEGEAVAVQLLDDAPQTVAAAWQLLARLSQVSGLGLGNAKISRNEAGGDRHRILLGSTANLPPAVLNGAPWQLGQKNRIHFDRGELHEPHEPGFWELLRRGLLGEHAQAPKSAQDLTASLELSGDLGEQHLIMAYPSASHAGRLDLAVLADSPDKLLAGVQKLSSAEYWFGLKGDTTVWKDTAESLQWQDSSASFFVGDAGAHVRLSAYFSSHPWRMLSAVLVFLAVFAWGLTRVLRGVKQRHGDVNELES